jgi:transposase
MEHSKRGWSARHDDELKVQVLSECGAPGASVAQVALAHGLNANLVHKWRRQAGGARLSVPTPTFIPVAMTPAATPVVDDIRIELRRGALAVNVTWPLAASAQCAAWLRETAAVIRIDSVWLAVEPLDMRAGTEAALARSCASSARAAAPRVPVRQPRANRMKVLVHDGIGVWLAARRLNRASSSGPRTRGRR